jgi:RimJ/RimL family protein N-acetyltransferase
VTSLVEAADADFEWLLEDAPAPPGLRLPPGGLDDPAILRLVRRTFGRLEEAGCRGRWMIVSGAEVVGLVSYKQPPKDGLAEIGYGIAVSRRGLGHATRAVAAVLREAERDPGVQVITAETSRDNAASVRVLEKNGFRRTGSRMDDRDGALICWRKAVGEEEL